MNMKLSYRDKVIFIAAVVLIVLIVGFLMFVKPKIQESQDMKANLETKEAELDEVHRKIETLDGLKTELKEVIKTVDNTQAMFLPEQYDFEADKYLYDLIKDTEGIRFNGMEIVGEEKGELAAYWYERNSIAYDIKMNADLSGDSLPQDVYDTYYDTRPNEPASAIVAVDNVTIKIDLRQDEDGTADWDTLFTIVDTISHHDKTLYLRTFGVDEKAESKTTDVEGVGDHTVTATFNVDIYSIHHMDPKQAE